MSFAPQVIVLPSDVINTTPNKCSDRMFVQPSNAAVTPFKSFCAMEIFLFTRLFDALVKIGPASVFTAGNLITSTQNLKSSRVSGFSAKEKGNPFDIIILKKDCETVECLVLTVDVTHNL